MTAYSGFAEIYDAYMHPEDYEHWFQGVNSLIKKYGIKSKSILELACGSGTFSILLAKAGYNVIGLDLSEDMLMIAKDKALKERVRIDFFQQDMTCYELNQRFDTVLSICDGMNYVLEEEDLLSIFQRVHNSLEENGVFIFDISSYYKLKYILGETTIAESRDDSAFIWENYFDETANILSFDLSVFKKENGLYRRVDELHEQRAYQIEEILTLSEKYFETIEVLDENFHVLDVEAYDEENMDNQRLYFILKKK